MNQDAFDAQILNLLSTHSPIKARQLAHILSNEFSLHVDRSDVNSALYRLKKEGKTKISKDYHWSLFGKRQLAQPTGVTVEPSIIFTEEQQAIIDLDPSQHLLIRGQAGSGKTTVLAARAGNILSAMNKGSLLFLTYNAALSAYVKKSFRTNGLGKEVDVKTFHDWSRHVVKVMGSEFNGWVDSKKRAEELKDIIDEVAKERGEHRLYNLNSLSRLLTWWGDEIAWLFGQHITRLDDYLRVERTGRGTAVRLTREDRLKVWPVYEMYQEWLEETRQEDYDNPAGLVLRSIMEQGEELPDELRYDHVMIDEVQDFDKSWLLAAVKIPRISMSMAGDIAQKIYHRNFSWSSVGIQVQGGRSRRLSTSHRTTRQIMDVAEYLLQDNDVTESSDYSQPVRPIKSGNKVKTLIADTPKQAYEQGYQYIADHYKRIRTTSVIVALPFSRQLYPAQKALEELDVKVRRVKGSGLGNFSGGVAVTTYHQLKGLEFDHVVIMGLHDAQFPGRLIDQIPEEDQMYELNLLRRLIFVAMTRAKESVTLVGSKPFCRFFDNVPTELTVAVD